MLSFKQKGSGRKPKITRRIALSYYRSPPTPAKSPFQRTSKPKRRGLLAKTLDWLIVLVFFAGVAYSLMLRPEPTVALSSTAYHSAAAYREVATIALKNLKNRNKLTFDENSLESALKARFPEISSVSADLSLFGQVPTVQIDIAKPSLILRGAEGTFGASERLIIDSKGTVIGPSSNFPSIKELPLITDETGFEARAGRSLLSLSDVRFILSIIAQAKKAKIPIASLTLPKLAQEVYLRTTDHSYYVKFYLSGDALTQSGQYLAARQQFEKTKKHPRQYLDVRVNGKIYYK